MTVLFLLLLFLTVVCWLLAHSYRVRRSPQLHPEFRKALQQLPSKYSPDSKQHFYKLIDTFGTHYITKVTTGGRRRARKSGSRV